MTDLLVMALRSKLMSRIKTKNTKPEILVRKILHKAGFRYRLHVITLPGKPDIVFPGKKKIIFVHGCFWHMHEGCARATLPKTRTNFWMEKLNSNRVRDVKCIAELEANGWDVLVIWECETKNKRALDEILMNFLKPPAPLNLSSC